MIRAGGKLGRSCATAARLPELSSSVHPDPTRPSVRGVSLSAPKGKEQSPGLKRQSQGLSVPRREAGECAENLGLAGPPG